MWLLMQADSGRSHLATLALLLLVSCSEPISRGAQEDRMLPEEIETSFSVTSKDGTEIYGQFDAPENSPLETPIVVMVSGTGLFDRNVEFGTSGTGADEIFKKLAEKLNTAGFITARYDKRGLRYDEDEGVIIDRVVTASATVETMRDDLRAVYDLVREKSSTDCIVLFGHSEGLQHIGRLAVAKAPEPTLVVAIGGPLQAPAEIFKWQLTERDAFSLRLMDIDRDGIVTNQEVKQSWRTTPSAVFNVEKRLLHPTGAWSTGAINVLVGAQTAIFEQGKATTLAIDDDAPYPDVGTASASYSWWKSWYLDETPTAQNLSNWGSPLLLFYGTLDSQVRHELQTQPFRQYLSSQGEMIVIPNVGHTLGDDVLRGPMDHSASEQLVASIQNTLPASCSKTLARKAMKGQN